MDVKYTENPFIFFIYFGYYKYSKYEKYTYQVNKFQRIVDMFQEI